MFDYIINLNRLKSEVEKLQAEHNEEIAQLQQKCKLEIESLKDQLLEAEVRRESLEMEVKLLEYSFINEIFM